MEPRMSVRVFHLSDETFLRMVELDEPENGLALPMTKSEIYERWEQYKEVYPGQFVVTWDGQIVAVSTIAVSVEPHLVWLHDSLEQRLADKIASARSN